MRSCAPQQMQKKVQADPQPEEHQPEQDSPAKSEDEREQPQPQDCSEKQIEGITIFCPICDDYISHSVTTTCEHTTCDLCLQEYLLFINECPECRIKIRNQKFANNILLDNLILEYIKKFEPEDLQEYEKRLDDYKDYKRRRTVGQLETGALLDIRDLDYVWCTGKVVRTINKFHDKKVKYVIVKYDKGNKKEEIPENSPRLAPRGFYTEREDLPKYERGKLVLKNSEQGVTYLISKDSEDEEIEEEVKMKGEGSV